MKPFSVLLLYPKYCTDDFGRETYYAHVLAKDNLDAIERAQKEACRHNEECIEPEDFFPLLVLEGHQHGLATEKDLA